SQVHAHEGPAYNFAWVDDELWTAGDDGALKRWAVRGSTIALRHTLLAPASIHFMKVGHGGWAANAGESNLLVGRDGNSVALQLELGRPIETLDVSPDFKYVAAGVSGEIVVIDVQRNAVATMTVGTPRPKFLSFIDAHVQPFSEVAALK